jgi:hypothetical protein
MYTELEGSLCINTLFYAFDLFVLSGLVFSNRFLYMINIL